MRVTFRLRQILEKHHAYNRGVINTLANGTGVPRQQIAALLKNRVKYVSLETLGAICDYLARTYEIDRSQLPGMLFALEPSRFLGLLECHEFIEICFGIRHDEEGHEMISAADSYLQGVILGELFGVGRKRHRDEVESDNQPQAGPQPQESTEDEQDEPRDGKQHSLDQQLVPAYDHSMDYEDARKLASDAYNDFHSRVAERTLICLGSVKSNVLIELLMANAFGAQPFVAQDDVETPDQRRCPIFFRLRERDPHPVSCYAGMQPAKSVTDSQPGIYYETEDGQWHCCPCTETEDAALVLYVQQRTAAVLEVVIGGFSGRATRALADELPKFVDELWPPGYKDQERSIGAFIVRFKVRSQDRSNSQITDGPVQDQRESELAYEEVIPLSGEVIRRRVEQEAAKSPPRS